MSTCNQLDLHTLGSQPVLPKNLPDHCLTLLKIWHKISQVIGDGRPYSTCVELHDFRGLYA